MTQNIPLAVALVTIGSFCFALSANFQHTAVGRGTHGNAAKERVGFGTLWASIRSKRWLAGLALMGVSLALQITALTMAPVSVVQPVGLLAFPWSVLLQARSSKSPIPKRVAAAVAVTVAATLAFTVITSISAAPESDLVVRRVIIGAVVVYLCALVFGILGSQGPVPWRCLFWASGGALFYGLEAALAKSLIEFARTNHWQSDPAFWGILAALLVGSATAGWMVQQGYATGPAELVVASMTITSPVVAVLFGIAVLGEGVRMTPLTAVGMVVLAVVAIAGVIQLARMHHDLEEAAAVAESTAERITGGHKAPATEA